MNGRVDTWRPETNTSFICRDRPSNQSINQSISSTQQKTHGIHARLHIDVSISSINRHTDTDTDGWGQITRRSFQREAFPRDDAQGYVSARCDSRAEMYPCASSRGNASRGKDRRVITSQPHHTHTDTDTYSAERCHISSIRNVIM